MGYTTEFEGSLEITPPIKPEHAAYIRKFCDTRRMKRDPSKLENEPDPLRLAVGLGLGIDGEYYTGSTAEYGGQDFTHPSVVEGNSPPATQPGLWCHWTIDDVGHLSWDDGEKFYYYYDWLEYVIEHFFSKWGYTLNGKIKWQGEENKDKGTLIVKDNKVTLEGKHLELCR